MGLIKDNPSSTKAGKERRRGNVQHPAGFKPTTFQYLADKPVLNRCASAGNIQRLVWCNLFNLLLLKLFSIDGSASSCFVTATVSRTMEPVCVAATVPTNSFLLPARNFPNRLLKWTQEKLQLFKSWAWIVRPNHPLYLLAMLLVSWLMRIVLLSRKCFRFEHNKVSG